MNHSAEPAVTATTVSISRMYNADRALVFDVWTRPEHIAHWFGPEGFRTTIHEMDVRAGGVWRFTMHGPDGTDYPNLVTYKEVVKPERLVYLQGDDAEPDRFEVTVTFKEHGEQTELHMISVFKSEARLKEAIEQFGVIEGLREHMLRLENWLTGLSAH